MLIPILDDNMEHIGNVEFVDNLTVPHVPEYVNMNCLIGITKLDQKYGKHEGEYVIMYYDKKYPRASYAEILKTKKEAYHECWIRGKLDLASQLGLHFVDGDVEVTETMED